MLEDQVVLSPSLKNPIFTHVPEFQNIELIDYYDTFKEYYPYCELQTKRWCVRSIKSDWHIFDIGANIGYYSILFSKLAPNGKVVAFEPTNTIDKLRNNIAYHKCSNITCLSEAVGSLCGPQDADIYRIWGQEPEKNTYTFTTVDDHLDEIALPRLDLLKIDVDSFDFDVLRGARQTLLEYNPYVLVELNHALSKRGYGPNDVLYWLQQLGYHEAKVFDRENFLLRRKKATVHNGFTLDFDLEPVYTQSNFVKAKHELTWSLSPPIQHTAKKPLNTNNYFEVGPTPWAYALSWSYKTATSIPIIIELELSVEGADLSLLALNESMDTKIGTEVFIGQGPAQKCSLLIEDPATACVFCLRKGPNLQKTASFYLHNVKAFPAVEQTLKLGSAFLQATKQVNLTTLERAADRDPPNAPLLDIVDIHKLHQRLVFSSPLSSPYLHIENPLENWNMNDGDGQILAQLYRQHQPKKHFEFGTWQGAGTLLAAKNSSATITTINLPNGEEINGAPLYQNSEGLVTDAGDQIGCLYKNTKYAKRITQLLQDSCQYEPSADDKASFDSILIDGGHQKRIVINDSRLAFQLAAPGALIIWHDFCPDKHSMQFNQASYEVLEGIRTILPEINEQCSQLFWIRPSWLLLAVKK
ncbi:class I SAM-dependent methyltransferase [Polycladidibacter stylochi]|uniref:class I SAM-dependent methyltransferase n=1 Tax=Polycladidibacter stylochi TaxID=1807766 RepID=UPI000830435F|nr:FkbM family methyltransferase [Pseudovibrio stylochi]